MADIVRYVDPDVVAGDSSGDSWENAYASLNAWESAEQTNLVTDTDTHTVYCRSSAGTADTVSCRISLWTTSASYYITIKAEDDNKAIKTGWDTNRYRMEITASGAGQECLSINEEFTRVIGLQLHIINSGENTASGINQEVSNATSDIRIGNCLIRATASGSGAYCMGIYSDQADTKVLVYNTIIRDFIDGAVTTCTGIRSESDIDVYNCIIRNCYRGLHEDAGTFDAVNCAVFACNSDFEADNGFNSIDHCASDDGDGTNSVQPADWDLVFTDPSNGDFSLILGCELMGAGTNLSGTFTTDMQGYTRANWDIGVDEYLDNSIIRFVDPDESGSNDGVTWENAYVSLNEWESSEQTDLTSDTTKHTVYCKSSAGTADTTAVNVVGWTTSASYDIFIVGADDFAGVWDTDKYRVSITDNRAIGISEEFITIRNLQFNIISDGSEAEGVETASVASGGLQKVEQCLFKGTILSGTQEIMGIRCTDNDTTLYASNNIIYDMANSTLLCYGIYGGNGDNHRIYNNTIVGCYSAVRVGGSGVDLKNNLVDNSLHATNTWIGTFANAYNNKWDNADTLSVSGTDTDNVGSLTFTFEDADNDDFHLSLNDASAIGQGIDLSSDGDYPITEDIDGNTRANWNVGADEILSNTIIRFVDPDESGSNDGITWANAYVSLNEWESAEDGDLTSSETKHKVYCRSSGGTADAVAVTINNWTTSSAYDITVEGSEDMGTSWNDSIYRLYVADSSVVAVYDDYVSFNKLQVGKSSGSSNNQAMFVFAVSATNDIRISRCILKQSGNGSYTEQCINANDADLILKVWDTIGYGCGAYDSNYNTTFLIQNCTTADFYNCTSYGGYHNYRRITTGTVTVTNSIASTAVNTNFNGTITVDYCASDDDTGTNSQTPSGSDWTNELKDPDNGDFTLIQGGNCEDGGTDDPSSGLYSTDINGVAYVTPWNIGVDAVGEAVGEAVVTAISVFPKTTRAIGMGILRGVGGF